VHVRQHVSRVQGRSHRSLRDMARRLARSINSTASRLADPHSEPKAARSHEAGRAGGAYRHAQPRCRLEWPGVFRAQENRWSFTEIVRKMRCAGVVKLAVDYASLWPSVLATSPGTAELRREGLAAPSPDRRVKSKTGMGVTPAMSRGRLLQCSMDFRHDFFPVLCKLGGCGVNFRL